MSSSHYILVIILFCLILFVYLFILSYYFILFCSNACSPDCWLSTWVSSVCSSLLGLLGVACGTFKIKSIFFVWNDKQTLHRFFFLILLNALCTGLQNFGISIIYKIVNIVTSLFFIWGGYWQSYTFKRFPDLFYWICLQDHSKRIQ